MVNAQTLKVLSFVMCHIHLRFHSNPSALHILSSLPSSLPMANPEAKSNPSKRLPSASLATLRIHQGGCLLGFTPVSIHTQFRSSFSLTVVTSRHLSTFSLQTPPSTKMPLLLWLCFAQTPMPMPMPTPTSTTCSSWRPSNQYVPSPTSSTTAVSLYRSVALARIPHSTPIAHPLQARRNLITQKNELFKSAADNISTHVMGRARSLR